MEGSALSERDLNRAKAESSSAAFVLANRFSSNYKQEDLNVQFQVRASEQLVVCNLKVQCETRWAMSVGTNRPHQSPVRGLAKAQVAMSPVVTH